MRSHAPQPHYPPQALALNQLIPWGRSFDEYQRMFNLNADDLSKRILGCGDGPAAFNYALTQLGGQVVSIDPLYRFSTQAIARRIATLYPQIIETTQHNLQHYHWNEISDPEHLGHLRMQSMRFFLRDFATGRANGRYQAAQLPSLKIPAQSFDLALCSHLLFLYDKAFSPAMHLNSILRLAAVANELRFYPLLNLQQQTPTFFYPLLKQLAAHGLHSKLVDVRYRFQKGAEQMLVITHA